MNNQGERSWESLHQGRVVGLKLGFTSAPLRGLDSKPLPGPTRRVSLERLEVGPDDLHFQQLPRDHALRTSGVEETDPRKCKDCDNDRESSGQDGEGRLLGQ